MGRKRYLNVVILDNEKDATLISAKEGYGNVNYELHVFPVNLVIQNRRPYWKAVKRSLEYSKMGIFNIIQKAD